MYRYHGWSLAEAALFFSPLDRHATTLTAGDVGRAWGLRGARARPYDKAVAELARCMPSNQKSPIELLRALGSLRVEVAIRIAFLGGASQVGAGQVP